MQLVSLFSFEFHQSTMRKFPLLVCLLVLVVRTRSAFLPETFGSEDTGALDDVTIEDSESAGSETDETRRSGDILGYLSSKIHGKLASIAAASSPHDHGTSGEGYSHKSFDFWTFKKALLSTLFQAVKAIKGGVIALKGQLLKAKGHLLASKGRLLTAKGEAISNFGKSIAVNALAPALPSSHPTSGASASDSWGGSGYSASGYSATGVGGGGGVSVSYGVPQPPPPVHNFAPSGFTGGLSAPAPFYGSPFKRAGAGTTGSAAPASQPLGKSIKLPEGATAGLLLLKPISVPSSVLQDPKTAASHRSETFLPSPITPEQKKRAEEIAEKIATFNKNIPTLVFHHHHDHK